MRQVLPILGWVIGTILGIVAIYTQTGVNSELVLSPIAFKLYDTADPNFWSLEPNLVNKGPAAARNVQVSISIEGLSKEQRCALKSARFDKPFLGVNQSVRKDILGTKQHYGWLETVHFCIVRDGLLPFEKFYTYGFARMKVVVLGNRIKGYTPPRHFETMLTGETVIEERAFSASAICRPMQGALPLCPQE